MPEKSAIMPKPMSCSVFLLKTVYFSPVTNTLYPLLGAVLAVLAGSDNLKKHYVLLALYAAGLTGYAIGPFLCIREPAGTFRLNPSFLLLPLSVKEILHNTLWSSVLYGGIINGILLLLMALQLGMPFVQNPGIEFMETPGGAKLPVATGIVWDVDGRTEIPYREVLDPSLIFGIVASTAGFPVFPAWPVLFFLFSTVITAYFSVSVAFKPFLRQTLLLRIFHGMLLCIYGAIGMVIAADVLFDTDNIWYWRKVLDMHAFILPSIAIGIVLVFTGGIVLLYRQSRMQNLE